MNQFKTIFSYELGGYLRNKVFKIFTIVVAAIILLALTLPPLLSDFFKGKPGETPEDLPVLMVIDEQGILPEAAALQAALTTHEVKKETKAKDIDTLKEQIGDNDDQAQAILVVKDELHYTLIEKDPSLSSLSGQLAALISSLRQQRIMAEAGMDETRIADAFTPPEIEPVRTGKDFWVGYSQTYAMLMLLYISVMIYGQFVAMSVANEKNSRAMEMLITSAKTRNLMFGKIIGIGTAGLLQLVVWLSCIVGGYLLNQEFWSGIPYVKDALALPPAIVFFTVLYYIIGFFMYASMYGAIGSLVSRVEDINTISMPVVLLILVSFFSAMSAIMSPDALYVKVMSLFPLTSPMVMFVRISMSEVHPLLILLSVVFSIGTTVLISLGAGAIYRIGVMMYGKPPSLRELIAALKNNKQARS